MASFLVTVAEATQWPVTSALAEYYGYPGDPEDVSAAVEIQAFVMDAIASRLASDAQQVLLRRAQNAALASVPTPPAPGITITPGTFQTAGAGSLSLGGRGSAS